MRCLQMHSEWEFKHEGGGQLKVTVEVIFIHLCLAVCSG